KQAATILLFLYLALVAMRVQRPYMYRALAWTASTASAWQVNRLYVLGCLITRPLELLRQVKWKWSLLLRLRLPKPPAYSARSRCPKMPRIYSPNEDHNW